MLFFRRNLMPGSHRGIGQLRQPEILERGTYAGRCGFKFLFLSASALGTATEGGLFNSEMKIFFDLAQLTYFSLSDFDLAR